MNAPARSENPVEVVLAVTVITAGAGWLGYRWFTGHRATVALPGPLLVIAVSAAVVAVLAAVVLWRGLHPAPAAEDRPERWALRFRRPAALIAIAAGVFAAALTVLGWTGHLPLLPAVGFAAAAALLATGLLWEPIAIAQRRTRLRNTLIQALYNPLGHRLPDPAVIPAIRWVPRSDTPKTVTVRAQRSAARAVLAAGEDDEPLDPDATPMRGDTSGIIRQALRLHAGVAMKVRANPSGLVYTAALQEAAPSDDSHAELTRKVKAVFGTGASVRPDSVTTDGDAITKFVVAHAIGHKLTGEFRKRLIEQNLSELLGWAWRASWDMTASTVTFELKPTLPLIVYPTPVPEVTSLEQAVSEYRQTRLDFGVDLDMNPQQWNPLDSPHCLTAGKTGAGKTVYLKTLVAQASRRGWAIVLIDFKGGSYSDLVDWPNVHIVSSDPYDSIATIHRMYALMNDRNARGRWDQKVWDNNVPYLIVIDEFTQLTEVIKRVWALAKPKGGPKDPPTVTELGELARLCRTARMHLVVGMQRPDADFLSTEVRDNFGNKVSVGPISRIAADMLFENAYTGRYVPRIKGRGMATGTHSEPRETQFYFTPPADTDNPEEAKVVAAMRPSRRLIPRYVPELPTDPAVASWRELTEARWFPLEQRPDLDPAKVSRQLTRFRGDPRLGFDDPAGAAAGGGQTHVVIDLDLRPADDGSSLDDTAAAEGRWEFLTVPAAEICQGDVVTFEGAPGHVDEVEIAPDGTVTIMWEDDHGHLGETQLAPEDPHKVLRRNSS